MAAKQCKKCKLNKSTLDFPRSRAPWFLDEGVADICYDCLNQMIDPLDLNSVDHMLQYLDIQFNPNQWMEAYQLAGDTCFQTYTTKFYSRRNSRNLDWKQANEAWKKKLESGRLNKEVRVLNQQWLDKMRKRWGDYTLEEYEILQAFYENVDHTQNIITAIQQDQAENMARLSLVIRRKIQDGDDASKEIRAYNDYIKSAGFEPKNARNYGDFESVGELINFLVKKGYKPKFYTQAPEEKDLVDLTMKNNQSYLRRLVHNEPGLADMVDQRKNSYRIAQQMEQDGVDEQTLDRYDNASVKLEYEGTAVDFQEALNE